VPASGGRREDDVREGLETLRSVAEGRYAWLIEPSGIVMETPEPEDGRDWTLRRILEANTRALFALPAHMADETGAAGEAPDAFADWDEDEFFLAFLNGRVAMVIACPHAEAARAALDRPLRAMADRLLRWNSAYRIDAKGRGLFAGRPRLDVIVVGSHGG
jgi:hypothetical protein